jgi:hypothetical protein
MTTNTVRQIQAAFDFIVDDLGILPEMVTSTVGSSINGSWTRLDLDLPDGSTLGAWDDDTDIVVTTRMDDFEVSRIRLSHVTGELLVAVLSALVNAGMGI